jgi:CHASE3 domain sensor protein
MSSTIFSFSNLGPLVFVLWFVMGILFFLLIRELMLWYWRINENTESLKRIADSLEIIAAAQDFMAGDIDSKNGTKKIVKQLENNKNENEK